MELEKILVDELVKRGYKTADSWKFINALTDFVDNGEEINNVANAILSGVSIHK